MNRLASLVGSQYSSCSRAWLRLSNAQSCCYSRRTSSSNSCRLFSVSSVNRFDKPPFVGYRVESYESTHIEEEGFRIEWERNGLDQQRRTRFQYMWLRDSCPCPVCVDPSTKQKLRRTTEMPFNYTAPRGSVAWENDVLTIDWEDHRSTYPLDWLHKHSSARILSTVQWDPPKVTTWVGKRLPTGIFIPFDSLQDQRGLALAYLLEFGIVFLTGVPCSPTAINDVAHTFGKIRETFYGTTWDVRAVQESKNIAYTDKDLGFHQDLLYFQTPPAYQILHSLKNQVEGGTSSFVDGFLAADTLHNRRLNAHKTLVRWPIPFQYVNDGHEYHAFHHTIVTDPEDKRVIQINYSPPFQAPFPVKYQPPIYYSLKRFASIVDDPIFAFRYRMKEGDCVIFNNRRILHARDAFDLAQGERWLKGCYLEDEEVIVNWRKYGRTIDS